MKVHQPIKKWKYLYIIKAASIFKRHLVVPELSCPMSEKIKKEIEYDDSGATTK